MTLTLSLTCYQTTSPLSLSSLWICVCCPSWSPEFSAGDAGGESSIPCGLGKTQLSTPHHSRKSHGGLKVLAYGTPHLGNLMTSNVSHSLSSTQLFHSPVPLIVAMSQPMLLLRVLDDLKYCCWGMLLRTMPSWKPPENIANSNRSPTSP